MTRSLRILPAAEADVDQAALHIAKNSMESALRFYDAVGRTYRDIRAHPNRWPRIELAHPRLSGLRRRSVSDFRNYLVFYRADATGVEIIRVLHGARDIPSVLMDNAVNR